MEQFTPLLTLDGTGKPHSLKITLPANTVTLLKRYCRYAGGNTDSAITQALHYVFNQDSGFAAWQKDPENLKEPEPRTRRKRNAATTSPASGDQAPVSAKAK